ncbi:endo-1,4-beta-xylanase [Anaerocolumna sp. AGMB13020]|uniref:endo-1,4-beta-xylanase n=1 Tax=Anaerocolumna sp. AGMB13020 TaxID=3081750 RepID=UPI002952998A|nr:endo-1,4-beta-xylanase [Anaerocolumna sp. AGMB13020]WOO38293.1 endo-1,4-beta-xylanase [Anaerocolumna sp. AGMB13020]
MLHKWNGRLRKLLSLAFVFLLLFLTAFQAVPAKAATAKSYNFSNLTYQSTWGVTYTINGGSATFNFEGQYREIKFRLPETLDMSQCTNVTFNASSPNGTIAFKLYDTAGNQAAVLYNFNSSTSDVSFAPNTSAQVNSIGIMAQGTSSYSAVVNSVTFTMSGSTAGANLKNTYGKVLSYSGAAVNSSQLRDATTLNVIKSQYNSITMENEMKPDAILGSSPRLITVAQANSNGYYIPSTYTETTVPTLNFSTLDAVLKICYDNGLKLRGHTLVWHGQTPDWFFRTGYSTSGAYVSQSVMDARMEFFIKSYMNHIYAGSYGSVVYAWDVVNEYLHAGTAGGWAKVYGSNLGTSAPYVKKAFQYAYDCLSYFGLTQSVKLFYNDYNTYEVTDKILALVGYINSGSKICSGVGAQSHLSTSYPSVASFKADIQKYINAGLEVQITELDVGNTSASEQATYVYNMMASLLSLKKAGGNITGITWWGLYDSVSWRSSSNPLLFSALTTPKASYNSALQAYFDAGYTVQ